MNPIIIIFLCVLAILTSAIVIREIKLTLKLNLNSKLKPNSFKFPDDFIETPHSALRGIIHWRLYNPNDESTLLCSIVGGIWIMEDGEPFSDVIHGDGVNTFEMFDSRDSEPRYHMTAEEINQHFQDNPFVL